LLLRVLRAACCVLRAACCVLRAACCVLRAACCVLRCVRMRVRVCVCRLTTKSRLKVVRHRKKKGKSSRPAWIRRYEACEDGADADGARSPRVKDHDEEEEPVLAREDAREEHQ
jgi:hypothetical protein